MDKIKPVGIWLRVSTEDQAKGESPEHHEKRGRYYAESKCWRVRKVYHLEAVSGKSVIGLPETQKRLGHIKTIDYLPTDLGDAPKASLNRCKTSRRFNRRKA